jgi:REP element-mobilizing transposase RayT
MNPKNQIVIFEADQHPNRLSLRLKGYDYAQAGAYFVTICTQGRVCLFGEVVDGAMRWNAAGAVVDAEWHGLPRRFPGVQTDAFVFMPNHVHGIIHVGAR